VRAWSLRRKALVVGLLLALALGLRLAEIERTTYRPIDDAVFYLTMASQIAHTGDYSISHRPGAGVAGSRGPTAYFPPAFPYFLALVDLIDGHRVARDGAVQPARISQAVLGTMTVGLVGLVGLEAFGELVGLIALGVAAIYPVLIELSGTLVAENLMTLLVLAAVWAALRAGRAGRPYRWIALAGVLTGLATLTHVNGIVLVVPLAIGAWSLARASKRPARGRLGAVALLLATTLLTLVPWTIRNAVELRHFVPVATETGFTLVGTYNAASASDYRIPYKWRPFYQIPGESPSLTHPSDFTEPALSSRLQSQAFRYIGRHPAAPFAVLYHNTRRLLELGGSFAWEASASSIDLPDSTARIGVFSFWVLCLLALAGIFTPIARRAPWWLWLVPVLLWLSVALVNAETPRFREPIDPFLILLGSCALAQALGAVAPRLVAPTRRHRRSPIAARSGQLVEVRERLT
jgi:4-amino-4-deoxy-L-arabinose transferase-like glycosyltransferase